ncbi:hypothetical protein B0H14DRAFT_2575868 [Mycena olivaceomarginata]|nr:hypothetical protein B0H14DRAFT_2575868 [Mycena olivaceomarginata]
MTNNDRRMKQSMLQQPGQEHDTVHVVDRAPLSGGRGCACRSSRHCISARGTTEVRRQDGGVVVDADEELAGAQREVRRAHEAPEKREVVRTLQMGRWWKNAASDLEMAWDLPSGISERGGRSEWAGGGCTEALALLHLAHGLVPALLPCERLALLGARMSAGSVRMPARMSHAHAPAVRRPTMRVPAVSTCACSASALPAVRRALPWQAPALPWPQGGANCGHMDATPLDKIATG